MVRPKFLRTAYATFGGRGHRRSSDTTHTQFFGNQRWQLTKAVRLEKVTYPERREINYDYGTTGAIDDIMSRLASIKDDDGSTVLASYKYLGAGRIVTEDYEEIEVNLDYNANDNLGGLDRFGRVADQEEGEV